VVGLAVVFAVAMIVSGLTFILAFITMVATVTVVTMIAAIAMVTTVPVITTAIAIAITRVGIAGAAMTAREITAASAVLRVRRLSMMLFP
jgi:hypothetical protein